MIRVRKFSDIAELELFLQGGIIGSAQVPTLFYGLVGKTIVFAKPTAATVTFTTGSNKIDPSALTFAQVKAQLEAGVTGLLVRQVNGHMVLVESTPTVGKGVSITGGTGRAELGLTEGATITGKVYSSDGTTVPYFIHAYASNDNSHVLVTQE